MSKIGSSSINDSDGSKKIEECSNLNSLHWFIVLTQRSHVRSGHGARVQYSLGTNMNTLFSSTIPKLEFRHSAGTRVQGRVGTEFLCVIIFVKSGEVNSFVLAAKSMSQNGV